MKIAYYYLLAILLTTLLFSCNEKDDFDKNEFSSLVTFNFDFNGFTQSRNSEYSEGCLSQQELIKLADERKLFARITIQETSTEIILNINSINGKYLQTKSHSFTINSNLTVYTISKAVITDDKGNILYSGIGLDSKFVNYVPEQELMGNKKITLSSDDRFQIIEQKLYVYCAYKLSPEDFGYAKWNINFFNIYNIPIVVTDCSENNLYKSELLTGNLKVEYKSLGDEKYTVLHESLKFGPESSLDNVISFKDNQDINNLDEEYRITISLKDIDGNTLKDTTVLTVDELLKFREYKDEYGNVAWDEKANLIHIDLCNNSTWIFDLEKDKYSAYIPQKIDKLILDFNIDTYSNCIENLWYYNNDKWENIPLSYIDEDYCLIIKPGMKIRSKDLIFLSLRNNEEKWFLSFCSPENINEDSKAKVSLYYDDNKLLYSYVIKSKSLIYDKLMYFYAFPYYNSIYNNNYYFVELENILSTDLKISLLRFYYNIL